MEDDEKPVAFFTVSPRRRALVCALCGAYVCTHGLLTIVAPADTDCDTTTLIANATASSDIGFPVFVSNAITEEEVRADMPKLYGVVIKPTKPST